MSVFISYMTYESIRSRASGCGDDPAADWCAKTLGENETKLLSIIIVNHVYSRMILPSRWISHLEKIKTRSDRS